MTEVAYGSTAAEAQVSPDPPKRRPHGGLLFLLAWTAGGLSVAAFLYAVSIETTLYGEPSYGALAQRWWAMVACGGFFQLAVLFGLVGVIVRALYFLPGDQEKSI